MPSVTKDVIRATNSQRISQLRRMWTPGRFAQAVHRARFQVTEETLAAMIDTGENNLFRWKHGQRPCPHTLLRIDHAMTGLLGPDWLHDACNGTTMNEAS